MGRLIGFFSKKLKSSSLTEVLVATTILVSVFAISIFTLNNVMQGSLKNQTNTMDFLIEKQIYLYNNNQLKVPFFFQEGDISITINKKEATNIGWLEFTAKNTQTNREISKQILAKQDDKEKD